MLSDTYNNSMSLSVVKTSFDVYFDVDACPIGLQSLLSLVKIGPKKIGKEKNRAQVKKYWSFPLKETHF